MLEKAKSIIIILNFQFLVLEIIHLPPWKIAICGLYKKLEFRLISKLDNKQIVFDDTVYFLGFNDEQIAHKTFELLTSEQALSFYSSQIFLD